MKDINRIIKGTGNFDNVKKGNIVSIEEHPENNYIFNGHFCEELIPNKKTISVYESRKRELQELRSDITKLRKYILLKEEFENEYIKNYYNSKLKNINIEELLKMLDERYGENIILVCNEPVGELCHRRIIADYIELKTGIYIPEISIAPYGSVRLLTPMNYKSQLKELMK